jgi:hypothetical protein
MNIATLVASPEAQEQTAARVSREVQQLWFAIENQSWSALLLVPAPGAGDTLALAAGLCEVSYLTDQEKPLALVDATSATLEKTAALVRQIAQQMERGLRVLVVIDALQENPASLALAALCDAAILCVGLGQTNVELARETIERCGRARFLGTVVQRP